MAAQRTTSSSSSKTTIAGLLERFVSKTTVHGCQFVSSGSGPVPARLVWVTVLLTVLTVNSLHLGFLISEYFEHKTNVNVHFADEKPVYPALIVCNTNPVRRAFVPPRYFFYEYLSPSPRQFFWHTDPSFIRDEMGHKPDYLHVYADDVEIDATNFKLFLDQNYYNCYYLDNYNVTVESVQQIKIFADVDLKQKTLSGLPFFLHDQFYPTDGLIIAMFDSGIMPPRRDSVLFENGMPFEGGKFAPVGSVLSIELKQSVRKSPGPPYVDCTENARLEHFNYSYSQLGCLNECKAVYLIDDCACVESRFQVPNDVYLYDAIRRRWPDTEHGQISPARFVVFNFYLDKFQRVFTVEGLHRKNNVF